MESVERLRSELENLLKELDQHEQTAASLDKKMDELVRSLVENGQVLTSSEVRIELIIGVFIDLRRS